MDNHIKEVQGSGKTPYQLNLKEVTCTCRDFTMRRRHKQIGDEGRLCKHLRQFADEINNTQTDDDGKVRYPREKFFKVIETITQARNLFTENDGIGRIEPCGSYRRKKRMLHDLDVVVECHDLGQLNKFFDFLIELGAVKLWRGDKKFSCKIHDLQVDFLITDDISYPFAVLHFTGSKSHNIKLRGIAKRKGLGLNEYYFKGVPQRPANKIIYKTEEDIFKELGVEYVEPENRQLEVLNLNFNKMKKIVKIITLLMLLLILLNCISSREVQETYSKGGYPSYHPTHTKSLIEK